jgi:murein DD-endopeptidase MepM/ murein hydrolase activator NlpD
MGALAVVLALAALVPASPVAAASYTYRFPVIGKSSFGPEGSHSSYPATDIIAACGLPVVSPVDGVVLEVERRHLWAKGIRNGSTRGGKFVSIKGVDGVRYYGSHLSRVTDGIAAGVRVAAGQRIGTVGKTGRAGGCHLHLGISPVCYKTGDWWIRRGVVWPNKFLRSWKRTDLEDRSPRKAISDWSAAYGCPASESELP